jgi:hypothetical protein
MSETEQPTYAQEPEPEPQPAPPVQQAPGQTARRTAPATPPAQAPTQAPAPAPAPQTIALTVPQGTELKVRIEDALDSGTTQPGEPFQATLLAPVVVGDRVVLSEGASLEGSVTDVIPAKKGIKESGGSLTLSFDRIATTSGQMVEMNAAVSRVAKSTKKKAGTIGGAAAGGALLGKVLGGDTKDAAVGAVVGGAIGTGIAAGTKGTEMKIEPGTEMTITLQEPLTVRLQR